MWGKRAFAAQNRQEFQKSEGEGENRAETKPWLLLALRELHLQELGVDALSWLSAQGGFSVLLSLPSPWMAHGWHHWGTLAGAGGATSQHSHGEDAQHQPMDVLHGEVEEGRSKTHS